MRSWICQAKVIALAVGGAMTYGIIHDQITARMCIEYFTIAHPPLVPTTSPTLLGLAWGVAATFWVGLILGFPLAFASQSPGLPPIPISQIRRAIIALLGIMGVAATVAGIIGFALSQHHLLLLPDGWIDVIPASQHPWFMAVWFAHGASYLSGLIGGGCLIFWAWNQRGRPRILTILPRSRFALIRAVILIVVLCLVVWSRFC